MQEATTRRWRAAMWVAGALALLNGCGGALVSRGVRMTGEEALPSNTSLASAAAVASLEELQRLDVSGTFGNLSGPLLEVDGSAIHLRRGARGETGPLVLALTVDTRDGLSGAFFGHLDLNEEQLGAYMSGELYLVVFTEAHPEGELRGQLGE